jgi:pentatricopeptide repeat protein
MIASALGESANHGPALQLITSVLWDHFITPILGLACVLSILYFARRASSSGKKHSHRKPESTVAVASKPMVVPPRDDKFKKNEWKPSDCDVNVAPSRVSPPGTPPGTPPGLEILPPGLELPLPVQRSATPPARHDEWMSPKASAHPWRKRTSSQMSMDKQSDPATPTSSPALRFDLEPRCETPQDRTPKNRAKPNRDMFCSSPGRISTKNEKMGEEAATALKSYWAASHAEDWMLALQSLIAAKNAGAQILDRTWSSVLAECVRLGIVDQAEQVLSPILNSLPVIGYNILMKAHVKNAAPKKCIKLYKTMQSAGVEPSAFTMSILLDAHVGNHDVDQAMSLLRQMECADLLGKPNSVHYTTILKGLIRGQRIKDAVIFFEEIPHPDVVTYSTLIKAHCDAGMVNEALELLNKMKSVGVMPDDIVFNTLLSNCSRNKNLALGHNLFGQMMEIQVVPSGTTLEHLVRLYYKTSRPDLATELLERVAQLKDPVGPTPKAYLDLMRQCIQQGRSEEAWRMYEVAEKHSIMDDKNPEQILKIFKEGKDQAMIQRVAANLKIGAGLNAAENFFQQDRNGRGRGQTGRAITSRSLRSRGGGH